MYSSTSNFPRPPSGFPHRQSPSGRRRLEHVFWEKAEASKSLRLTRSRDQEPDYALGNEPLFKVGRWTL